MPFEEIITDSRNLPSTFSLTLDTVTKLAILSEHTGKKKSMLVREGIDMLYQKYESKASK